MTRPNSQPVLVRLRPTRAELKDGRQGDPEMVYVVVRAHGLSLRISPVHARGDVGDRIVAPGRLTLVTS